MRNLKMVMGFLILSYNAFSQNNVGIGTSAPTEALSIGNGLNIDHNNQNPGSSLLNGLRFGNTATTLQMVGISSNRTGASQPFSLDFYTANQRRMIVTQDGLVGINVVPSSYYFEVGGTIKGLTLRAAGSIFAEGGSINASTSVNAGANVTADNTITATNGDIIATNGDIVATNGQLKADGKGVVMSNNAVRQRMVAYTATMSVSNLAIGTSVTGNITMSAGTFTTAPTAYVGNVITENGEYYKVMLVLENVTTTNITIRIVNVSSDAVTFSNVQWKIMAIGAF